MLTDMAAALPAVAPVLANISSGTGANVGSGASVGGGVRVGGGDSVGQGVAVGSSTGVGEMADGPMSANALAASRRATKSQATSRLIRLRPTIVALKPYPTLLRRL